MYGGIMYRKAISAVITLLLLSLPGVATALTSDREQPIRIEADSMSIDESKGVSIYQGRVSYVQGTIKMTADKVFVYTNGGEFSRFEAHGERVHYQQVLDDDKGELQAKARVIDYHAAREHILLKGNAHVKRGEDEFSGSHIEYDAQQDIVNARATDGGNERVQVIIQPRENGAAKKSGQ